MSSDIEFDDIDEADLLQAISQVSQANATSPQPSTRRYISPPTNSHQSDDIIDSDPDLPSAPQRNALARSRKRFLSLEQDSLADEDQALKRVAKEPKKKKKHLIHIPKVHKQFEDTYEYGTQVPNGEPKSSPYIARGARWKLPKPSFGETEKRQTKSFAQKNAPSLDAFFKPSALKETPSNRSHPNREPDNLGPTNSSTRSVSSLGKADSAPAPIFSSRPTTSDSINHISRATDINNVPSDIEDEFALLPRPTTSTNIGFNSKTGASAKISGPSDADLAKELADIGSDFWTPSPEEPEFVGQRLVAPQTNLRQTTLFGDKVLQSQIPASQANMVRQYRMDRPSELPTHHKIDLEAMKTWVYPTNLGQIRDYQYSIVKTGLFSNTLVALPTGLGKTFIAATIMLNYYRWTTDAQIIFMAPTKPLVSQQVNACFNVAGIPRSVTTMLNGEVKKELREEAWVEKRVFFVTPQTLENDLRSGLADPRRIVLMVIDEAHRATGKYAYVKCIEKIRAFSKSFRVLALTATPGSNVEKVQEVIDGLEIAKIEIRTEASIDIQPFVHRRNIDEIVLEPSDEMNEITDLFSKAIQPLVNILCGQKAYYNRDPMSLTPFGLLQAHREWSSSPAGRTVSEGIKNQMRAVVAILSSIAHSIKLLKFHGMIPFYANLKAFREQVDEKGEKGSKYKKQIVDSSEFKETMNHLQRWTANDDFIGHPKITVLCDTILNHFMDAGEGTDATISNTKVMVFSEFRDSAEVIVSELRKHKPMIKPSMFVGQADSGRSAGMKQSKQSEVIADFKKGQFNVLVATSIGEEGLDIGEVDLIICYDTSASPIRMLQRMGRTGRKRAGRIVCLMMKGKEHDNFAKAKDNYEKMQQLISNGSQFAFRDDLSTRIVPRGVNPEVDKRDVEIPFENTQDQSLPVPRVRARGVVKKKIAKKFHMPDGIVSGFQKASRIAEKGGFVASKARKPRKTQKQIRREEELSIQEQTPIPKLNSVFLAPEEERELERCYQNVGGSAWDQDIDAPIVETPNLSKYPQHQRSFRPTGRVGHSRATKDLVSILQNMHNICAFTLDKWKRTQNTYPDPAMKASSAQDIEEELDEDLIGRSMAVESESDGGIEATEIFGQSTEPHGSITLGSDTEDEDPDNDQESDLSDFVVNDVFRETSQISSSIIASSLHVAETARAPPKPYYQPVYLPETLDIEDDLPDIAALARKNRKDDSPSRTIVSDVVRVSGRKKPWVLESDSDE